MHESEIHPRSAPRVGQGALKSSFIGASVVALITLGLMLWQSGLESSNVSSSSGTPTDEISATSTVPVKASRDVYRAAFFDDKVQPEIANTDALNREAVSRCLTRLDRMIDRYHRGVDPFVGDLTSISTRLGIVRRMPGGWWEKDDRVQRYVQNKFEEHLFSEEQLLSDVTGVLEDFKSEVDANQKRMLISIQAALSESDLPEVMAQEYPQFFSSVSESLQGYATDQGTSSIQNMIGAFVLGEAGAFAARSILTSLLTRFAPGAVVATAAGATATAGSSAAGAGGGSIGGPAGAVVGFGVGLAVGLVIDWWMTEKFETKLKAQMHRYLDDLGNALVSGPKYSSGATASTDIVRPSVGLEEALPKLCDALVVAYRDRFFQQIVTGATEQ